MVIQKRRRNKKSVTKAIPWIIIGIAFILLFTKTAAKLHVSANVSQFPETAGVFKVIDGDTIILTSRQHVRYLGIDTPETRRKVGSEWQYMPEPFSEDAKEFNASLVEGKRVRLEYDVERVDKYGRVLAYVRLEDGTFVNAELLKKGLAKTLIIPPNTQYADFFYDAEKRARSEKIGIWGVSR